MNKNYLITNKYFFDKKLLDLFSLNKWIQLFIIINRYIFEFILIINFTDCQFLFFIILICDLLLDCN